MDPLSVFLIMTAVGYGLNYLTNSMIQEHGIQQQGGENRANMEFQHELNVEDWQMENEYNLPKNQYNRYVDAGISPSAAAQAVAGGSNAAGGSVNATTNNPPNIPGFDSAGLNNLLGRLPNNLLDARSNAAEVALKEAEAKYKNFLVDRGKELLPNEIENIKSEVRKNNSIFDSNEALAGYYSKQADRLSELLPYEVLEYQENYVSWIQKLEKGLQEINNLKKDIEVKDAEISELNARGNLEATEAQGEVYTNYSKMVQALRDDAQRAVVELFHANPEDEVWKQLIESYAHGEKTLIEFISACDQTAQDVYDTLEGKHPKTFKAGKTAAAIYGGKKALDFITPDMDLGQLLQIISMFSPTSVASPIGFIK